MRFLSLWQPWASLMAIGAKQVETRSWATDYRGLVGIHATKAFPSSARVLCWKPPFAQALIRAGLNHPDSLPRGAVVAVARIEDCMPTEEARHGFYLPTPERPFGDYSDGRFAWFLADVRCLPAPILWRGRQGLWADPDLESKVRKVCDA